MRLARPSTLIALFVAIALLALQFAAPADAQSRRKLRALPTRDAKALGEKIEQAMAARDSQTLDALVHIDSLLDRVMDGLDADALRDDLSAALKETLTGADGIARSTMRELGEPSAGGTYKFLRARRVRGRSQLQFRLNTPAGHNYHEYMVARDADGNPVITDLYIFLASEWYSQSCRRLIIVLLAEESKARLQRGAMKRLIEAGETLDKMNKAASEQRYAEAVALLAQLPRPLRTDKSFLALNVIWSQYVGEQQWELALAEFRGRCPNEPGAALAGLPLDLKKGRYNEAYRALDIVDRAVGGDPYLHLQRAVVASHEANWGKVKQFAQKAVDGDPELTEGWELLVAVPLASGQYSEVVKQLNAIESKKQDVDVVIARVQAAYGQPWAEFQATNNYKTWKTARDRRNRGR